MYECLTSGYGPVVIKKYQRQEEKKMENKEQIIGRINFCARTLKAFGAGQLIVDAGYPTLRFEVNDCGRIRIYRTLEELESFAEALITNRHRRAHSYRAASRGVRRSRQMAAWVA